MRVRDPELLRALCRSPLKDAIFIHLDFADIEDVTVLDKCLGVVNLSLTGNRLAALGGHIRYCRQLWRLILARNQIESVRELTAFPALGYLDVSHNPLTYEALLALRDLHIVHLVAEGCTGVCGAPGSRQERLNLIWLLPNVWVLNNHFITMVERQDADVLVDERLRALVSARQAAMGGPAPVRSFLATKGAFEGNMEGDYDSVGVLAVEFMRLISGQPPSGVARDVFRLTYLADFHEKEATRHNACVRQQVAGTPLAALPHMSLSAFNRMPTRVRLDVAVLLACTVHGPVPAQMLEDALCILCLDHMPLHKAKDLGRLPPYAVSSLCLHTRELARHHTRYGREEYKGIAAQLLDALEAVIHGAQEHGEGDALHPLHRQRLDLIARHAVLLISRAPSCPPLSTPPTSAAVQRDYDALMPLLRRAGLSNVDLFGSAVTQTRPGTSNWRFGEGTPAAGASSLAWNKASGPKRPYARPWTSGPGAQQEGDEQKQKDAPTAKTETEAQQPSTAPLQPSSAAAALGLPLTLPPPKRPATIHGSGPLYMLDSEASQRRNPTLLTPGVGQAVELQHGISTVITSVDVEHATVCVADCDALQSRPFNGSSVVRRDDIAWDPRGWWRHRNVLAEAAIARPHSLLRPPRPSPCARAATPAVRGFTVTSATWDVSFFLAPEARVQSPPVSRPNTAGEWVKLETPIEEPTARPETAAEEGCVRMPPWSLLSSDTIVKRRRKLGTGTRPSTSLGPVKPYPPKRLEKQSLYYVAGSNRGLNTGDDASTDKERRQLEEWHEMQRSMGSFRRDNVHGARRHPQACIDHVKELLRLRRGLAGGLFKLTAVAVDGPEREQQPVPLAPDTKAGSSEVARGPEPPTGVGPTEPRAPEGEETRPPTPSAGPCGELVAALRPSSRPRSLPLGAQRSAWHGLSSRARLFIASPLELLRGQTSASRRRFAACMTADPGLQARLKRRVRMAMFSGAPVAKLAGVESLVWPMYQPTTALSPRSRMIQLVPHRKPAFVLRPGTFSESSVGDGDDEEDEEEEEGGHFVDEQEGNESGSQADAGDASSTRYSYPSRVKVGEDSVMQMASSSVELPSRSLVKQYVFSLKTVSKQGLGSVLSPASGATLGDSPRSRLSHFSACPPSSVRHARSWGDDSVLIAESPLSEDDRCEPWLEVQGGRPSYSRERKRRPQSRGDGAGTPLPTAE